MRAAFILAGALIVATAALAMHHNDYAAYRDWSAATAGRNADEVAAEMTDASNHFGHRSCHANGELRRHFDCAAVKHTKKDVCCWQMRSGDSGVLPYECCGTGWSSLRCDRLVNALCASHHVGTPAHEQHKTDKHAANGHEHNDRHDAGRHRKHQSVGNSDDAAGVLREEARPAQLEVAPEPIR